MHRLMPRIDFTLALVAVILALGGAFFVLLFWVMGAINLSVGQGLIAEMTVGGLGRALYFAYPFLVAISAVGAVVLLVLRQPAPAVGLAGLPIAGATLYYLALTTLNRG